MNLAAKNEAKNPGRYFSDSLHRCGAGIGISVGLFFLLSGAIMTIVSFFEKINFDKTELLLLCTSFIFLGVGAHCLDLREKK